jgi:hypothetical protein
MEDNPVLTWINGGAYSDVYVYIQDNLLVFGFEVGSSNASLSGSGTNTVIRYGVSGYPTGSIHLGHTVYSSNCFCSDVSDDRPSAFQ